MSEPLSLRAGTVQAAFLGFITWVVVVAAPMSGSSMLAAAELVAVGLVLLVLARTRSSVSPSLVTVLFACGNGVTVAAKAGCRVLRTRPTDPVHHPLAPRAPGVA